MAGNPFATPDPSDESEPPGGPPPSWPPLQGTVARLTAGDALVMRPGGKETLQGEGTALSTLVVVSNLSAPSACAIARRPLTLEQAPSQCCRRPVDH